MSLCRLWLLLGWVALLPAHAVGAEPPIATTRCEQPLVLHHSVVPMYLGTRNNKTLNVSNAVWQGHNQRRASARPAPNRSRWPLELARKNEILSVSADGPSEAVRDGLRSSRQTPWYDEESGGLVAIPVEQDRRDARNRDSSWEQQWSGSNRRFNWNSSWLATLLQALAWTLLIVLVLSLISILIWAFLRREGGAAYSGGRGSGMSQEDLERVEKLPFQVANPTGDFLAEAKRCFDKGDYRQALIYLFSFQLVFLDRKQIIRLTRGKTNRQYLWELRRRPELSDLLRPTMLAFEDVFFGGHGISSDRFRSCWDQSNALRGKLEQSS